MIALISIFVAVAVAFITLDWFFKDGDDSTEQMQEDSANSWNPYYYNRFSIWLIVSAGAGGLCYRFLPVAITYVHTHL